MRIVATVALLLAASAACGQAPPPARTSGAAPTPDALKRDSLLQPALEQMRQGNAAQALIDLRPAIEAYPDNAAVLALAAEAATASHQDAAALTFFHRALDQHPPDPWHIRLGMLLLEARLGQWSDFDRDQTELKQARLAGDKELAASSGYLIDAFEANGRTVTVAYFPSLAGQFKTLYRFLLPAPAAEKSPAAPGRDRCTDSNFRPYVDVESDDIDQARFATGHPDLAKKGERSYSLDTYPAACSQGLIKFYPEGEPKYERVREDVIKYLQASAAHPAKP